MRRDEVQPLLERAADRLPVPDLADAAWAAGLEIRRRRRRGTAAAVAVVLVAAAIVALLAATNGDKAEPVPPDVLPSSSPTAVPPGTVPRAGVIAGLDYWMAPPAGSERFLDRVATPLGDTLRVPDKPGDLASHPVSQITAVVLGRHGDRYRPLLLDADGHWGEAPVDLLSVRDGPTGRGPPLSAASVAPNGRLVAFPQSGALVLVDGATADVRRIEIPEQDIRTVSWLPDSERVLVSGEDVAFRILVGAAMPGEQLVTVIPGSNDPADVTAPYRLSSDGGQVLLAQYSTASGWAVQGRLQLPVTGWSGQTFSTASGVARLFLAEQLPQIPTIVSQPQVVAVISTAWNVPSRLLVLGETPPGTPGKTDPDEVRVPGCCSVLGWYDARTVLVRVVGKHTAWILAWDLRTSQVRRVTELEVGPIALGPGIRV
jgi:hypothetical protein